MKMWSYLIALVTLILFVFLLTNFDGKQFVQFDETMANYFSGNEFLKLFHFFGETVVIVTVSIIALIFLFIRQKNYRGMLFVLLTVGGGNVLNKVVKEWVERPRPDMTEQLTSYSFPSGHAMVGLLYLLTIAYLLSEVLRSNKQVFFVWAVTIVLAILVGLSRIAATHHFATDVIAGWCLGYTWLAICIFWYERRKRQLTTIKKSGT